MFREFRLLRAGDEIMELWNHIRFRAPRLYISFLQYVTTKKTNETRLKNPINVASQMHICKHFIIMLHVLAMFM